MTQNCEKCDKVFGTKSALEEHMPSHDDLKGSRRRGRPGSKIPCIDCDEVFFRRCDLRIHRRVAHQAKKNACGVCGRTFSCGKRLKMHSQFHNTGGEYECFYCMKEFNKGWKLKIHLVNHSGRAPYICQFCKEDFLYPGKILEHFKHKHGIMTACKDCGEAFRKCDDQRDHICKLYGCKDCNAYFITVEELASHAILHKNEPHLVEEMASPLTSPGNNVSVNEIPAPNVSVDEPITICYPVQQGALSGTSPSYNVNTNCPPSVTVNVTAHQPVANVPSCQESPSIEVNVSTSHPSVEVDVSCRKPEVDSLTNGDSSNQLIKESNDSCFPTKFTIKTLNFGVSKWLLDMPEILTEKSQLNGIVHTEDVIDILDTSKKSSACNPRDVLQAYDLDRDSDISIVKEITVCNVPSSSKYMAEVKCNDQFSFKVPLSNWIPQKRISSTVKTNWHNSERWQKKSNAADEEWMVSVDKNFAKEEHVSLESWLTSDTSSCIKRDFVFGLESCEPVNKMDFHYHSSKISLKKNECDMTFEDLCQF